MIAIPLNKAKDLADKKALEALHDDDHFYVCPIIERPRSFTVVSDTEYGALLRQGIGRPVYTMNKRYAVMEAAHNG